MRRKRESGERIVPHSLNAATSSGCIPTLSNVGVGFGGHGISVGVILSDSGRGMCQESQLHASSCTGTDGAEPGFKVAFRYHLIVWLRVNSVGEGRRAAVSDQFKVVFTL